MKSFWFFVLPIIALVLSWEGVSRFNFVNSALFPAPSEVFWGTYELVKSGLLLGDLVDSMRRMALGLLIGILSGIGIGVLTGRLRVFSLVFSPTLQMFRALPPVAILPLVIVWFGIDDGAKIFSIAFAVFFPVWINTHIGVGHVEKAYLWNARLLTKSKMKVFWQVILPASLHFVIAGIRTGIAIGFIMIFVSELSGASSGIGYRISISNLSYRIDQMIGAMIVLGGLGAFFDQLFVIFGKRLFPWLRFI